MRRRLERIKRQRDALASRIRTLSEEKAVLQSKIEQGLSYVVDVDQDHDESAFSLRQRLWHAKYALDDSSDKERKRQKRLSRLCRRAAKRKPKLND
jgi:hypothetical protein